MLNSSLLALNEVYILAGLGGIMMSHGKLMTQRRQQTHKVVEVSKPKYI